MIDDDDVEDDFIETLGLDDFLSTSDYGRDRGKYSNNFNSYC